MALARSEWVFGGAILLFTAVVFALMVALNEPLSGLAILYVLPIALVALERGMPAGLAAAAAAAGLFIAWVEIDSVPMNPVAYAARPFIYFSIAVIVGLVAERLRVSNSEQASAERLQRSILATSNEAFIAVDRAGSMTDWNEAAERTFGWSAEEAIGKPLSEVLVPADQRKEFTEGLRRYLETGEKTLLGKRVEADAIHRDGGEISVELSSATVGEGPELRLYAFVRDISERKRSERQLEQAARYFDLSHDLIATATPDLHFDQVNSRWQAALGWTPEELRGRPLVGFIHPDDREPTAKEITRVMEGGEPVDFLNRYRAKDGSWHSLEWSAVLWPDENRVYGAARDVTERIKADEANRRLGAIVDSSSDAIYGYSLDGEITSWNDAAERLYGYPPHEAVGMHLSRLAPPDRPDDTEAILARVSRGEVAAARETVRLRKDGRSVDVSVTAAPVRGADGSLVGASTIARDISDRKRTARYMGAQHLVTAILATAPPVGELGAQVLPIIAGSAGCTHAVYWSANDASEELRCDATWTAPRLRGAVPPVRSGVTWKPGADGEAEALCESAWEPDLGPASRLPLAEQAITAGMGAAMWFPVMRDTRLQGGFQFFDRENRERDDELMTVLGSVVAQIGLYTERKCAEEEAEHVKTEFFSLISHELRTPLTSIIGYTEILAETEARLSEQGRRFLAIVERNGRRELRLVQDLLLLVRIEAGTFSIAPGHANLKQIAEDSIEAVRPTAELQHVGLTLQVEPIPEFEADPLRLGQVIDNLLTNAIKFSPEGGEVEVRLHRENGSALIEVSDTGMGIPADETDRLFERLFRAKNATAMQIPGTGLGLSVVKGIVDAHGGRIGLESEDGEGTTFRIDLPMHMRDHDGAARQKERTM